MKLNLDPFTRELMLRVDELTRRVEALEARKTPAEKLTGAQIVLEEVSRVFLLPVAALKSTSRSRDVVQARWAAMLLMHTTLGMSCNRVGTIIGKDHSGVKYACGEMVLRMLEDRPLYAEYERAEKAVEERLKKARLQ